MIKFDYEPHKLIKAAYEIRQLHTKKSSDKIEIPESDGKRIIKEAISKSKKEIESYALFLPDYELEYIAMYVPHNYFNVYQANLFMILKFRMNDSVFETVYKNWGDKYTDNTVTKFISDCIKDAEKYNCEKFVRSVHLNENIFDKICNSKNIIESFCKILVQYKNQKNISFNDAINKFGLSNTKLAFDAEKYFILYCSKADYCAMGAKNLAKTISGYSSDFLIKFFRNFLYEFNLHESELMQEFYNLWDKAYNLIGHPSYEKYKKFFAESDNKIHIASEVYCRWYSLNELYKVINDESRRSFWQAAIYEFNSPSFLYYKAKDMLYMQFGNENTVQICVLEFGTMGPLYIFTKKYYNAKIERLVKNSCLVSDFKSELFRCHDFKEGFENRFVHRGDWKNRVRTAMKNLLKNA